MTEPLARCDGGCHDRAEDCSLCASGTEVMCEDCKSYAAQDADRP